MQRMQVEGGNVDRAAARLAVETVELVRASLAGLWPSPAVAAPPPETVEKPATPRPGRLALAVSVGRLTDFGDAPATWAPQVAASYRPTETIGVRLSGSGLGPGADVSSTMGSARIDRSMLTLGLVRAFRADRTVQPMIGIAAGVQHLSVHGTAPAAERAHDTGAFSALATASAGVAVALGPRVAVVAEADLLMPWPSHNVLVGDAVVATFDRPSLFTHAGLLATF